MYIHTCSYMYLYVVDCGTPYDALSINDEGSPGVEGEKNEGGRQGGREGGNQAGSQAGRQAGRQAAHRRATPWSSRRTP